MEVHHHPQLQHQPKAWKEYLLEYLMIFLAVVTGFFAESYRESRVNREKENHYIEGIIFDLRKDITEVEWSINFQQFLVNKMDSALQVPAESLKNMGAQNLFYHHFVYFYAWDNTFTNHDNTFSQLKNAGGFSVIRNHAVIDSIEEVYAFCERGVKLNEQYYVDYYRKVVDLGMQVMKLPELQDNFSTTFLNDMPNDSEVFTTYDNVKLQQLYNAIRYQKGCLKYYISQEREYKELATRLVAFLTNKYHLG